MTSSRTSARSVWRSKMVPPGFFGHMGLGAVTPVSVRTTLLELKKTHRAYLTLVWLVDTSEVIQASTSVLALLCGPNCQRPRTPSRTLTKLPWNQRCYRRSAIVATKNTSSMAINSVLWFRKGLRCVSCKPFNCQTLSLSATITTILDSLGLPTCRLHDNPALHAALKDCDHLYPVFCLDPW